DVSEAAGLIRVTSAHKGGARFRDVPIHAGLQVHLDAWKKEDGGKGPLIRYGRRAILKIQTSWENALQRAGIRRRLRPYDLRHAFITRALSEGADIGAVSNLVGSSPETIRRHYQYVSRAMERRTVGMIAALDVVPSVPRTKGKKKK
ncbi:MAG TPA: integrase, partial [Verrucomicrobia bacterium]|nr:integrase [Verrucomicrobiota bacterium]